jgi:hypothetical protein
MPIPSEMGIDILGATKGTRKVLFFSLKSQEKGGAFVRPEEVPADI